MNIRKILKDLKIKFDCKVMHVHIADLGPDWQTWVDESKKIVEENGYYDLYCQYCGEHLARLWRTREMMEAAKHDG